MHVIRIADKKAPRFRPQQYFVFNEEFCIEFKKKYPKYKKINNQTLRKILYEFNSEFFKVVVEEREGVSLPEQLGFLFIGSLKSCVGYDYGASNRLGKPIRASNLATDGLTAKIMYSNSAYNIKFQFRELWAFRAARNFKNLVSSTYPLEFNKYMVLDNLKKPTELLKKKNHKERILKNQEEELKNYNDLDID